MRLVSNAIARRVRPFVTSLAFVVGSASIVMAQATATVHESRWQPWLGCWRPTTSVMPIAPRTPEMATAPTETTLCVVPGSTPTSVDVVNFSGGRITERTTIEPAQPTTKTVGECSGTETATWSGDGRRLYLRGTFTCGQGVTRKESGIMSLSADGEWVQAQSVAVNGNVTTYVAHFHDSGIALDGIANGAIVERPMLDRDGTRISPPRDGCVGSESVQVSIDSSRRSVVSDYTCATGMHRVANAEFARSASGQWTRVGAPVVLFGTPSVRAAAGAPVALDDVLEASKSVEASVAEAWIIDRDQAFEVSGKDLVRLADRGMPSRVIDMIVAVSNPQAFSLKRDDANSAQRGGANANRNGGVAANAIPRGCGATMDYCGGALGLGWLYGVDRYYGWTGYGYDPYGLYGGLSRYGYGYGYGGYGGYGYPYYGPGYSNGGPVVIVVGTPASQTRGSAVYGQGYTRGSSSGSSSSSGDRYVPTSRGSSSSGSSSSSSSGSSSGSSSSGSSSSGGGGDSRTAKPRGGGL